MENETAPTEHEHRQMKVIHQGGGSDNVYGIGIIGAWVYYFKGVTTFQEGAKAFFKGLVWPAFMVYELLVFLNKK
jgi:hypothetical protein